MLAKAIAEVATIFQNKKDKAGQPYILHCLFVMNKMQEQKQSEDVQIAALAHDVLEDTHWTADDLIKMGFSKKSIFLIEVLTHNPKDSYNQYIGQISIHPEAILIKMADLEHNSQMLRLRNYTDRDMLRLEKYHKAYYFLKDIKDKNDSRRV